jgi:hypothetical protein
MTTKKAIERTKGAMLMLVKPWLGRVDSTGGGSGNKSIWHILELDEVVNGLIAVSEALAKRD